MKTVTMKKTLAILCTGMLLNCAQAAEYLGLDLGKASKEQVSQVLKAANASFEDDYSYKGQGSLASYKVQSYQRFDKFGEVKQAWLEFSPKGLLYRISVQYADSGQTFKTLKDALDSKYGAARKSGEGFNAEYAYRDGKTSVFLQRDTFGFGNDQKTTLIYVWTPMHAEVLKMKETIEANIRKNNANKAAGDL